MSSLFERICLPEPLFLSLCSLNVYLLVLSIDLTIVYALGLCSIFSLRMAGWLVFSTDVIPCS